MERLVIELSNIGLNFGKHKILEGANMSAKAGEIVGLMGPNGSGKSSLIKLLAGVYVPSSGIGIVCDRSLGGPKHPKVGVMFEYPPFIGELGAKENMQLLARLQGASVDEAQARTEAAGISWDNSCPVKKFSQGMKKRLGLAQALLGSPELILMDEPMNGLDVLGLEMLADAIRTAAKQGSCVLVSSHNLELLGELCDSVYGVLDHKLVQVKPKYIHRAGLRDAYLELCR